MEKRLICFFLIVAAMSPPVTVVSESTASILVDEVWLVDSIITVRTWISTIRVTLERSECGISISRAIISGSPLSTLIRYVVGFFLFCLGMG